jgi:hypothetical protein
MLWLVHVENFVPLSGSNCHIAYIVPSKIANIYGPVVDLAIVQEALHKNTLNQNDSQGICQSTGLDIEL